MRKLGWGGIMLTSLSGSFVSAEVLVLASLLF
jgi:hypothetical protein